MGRTAADQEVRTCSCCEQVLPIDKFYPNYPGQQCIECLLRKNREWHAHHRRSRIGRNRASDTPLAVRRRQLWRKYKLTPEQYEKIFEEQNGVCAVCFQPEVVTDHRTGAVRWLCVDHDHACCPGETSCGACLRGLLCASCNFAMGLVDRPGWPLAALAYLDFYRKGSK